MGKLSSYEYPDYSLYDSLELAELINDTYSGSVSRSVLSDALNMSTFGGAFASKLAAARLWGCLLYTSPSPRDGLLSRMPSSA